MDDGLASSSRGVQHGVEPLGPEIPHPNRFSDRRISSVRGPLTPERRQLVIVRPILAFRTHDVEPAACDGPGRFDPLAGSISTSFAFSTISRKSSISLDASILAPSGLVADVRVSCRIRISGTAELDVVHAAMLVAIVIAPGRRFGDDEPPVHGSRVQHRNSWQVCGAPRHKASPCRLGGEIDLL